VPRSIIELKPVQRLIPSRYRIQAVADALVWMVAVALAVVLRYEFDLPRYAPRGLVMALPLSALCQAVAGLGSGLYQGRWRFGSFDEVAAVARTVALATALLLALDVWVGGEPRMIPIGAVFIAGFLAFVLMGGLRYVWRLALEVNRRPGAEARRTIVFGAGEGGSQVVTAMLRTPESPYLPVALLDDANHKRRLSISGVKVVGTRHQLRSAAAKYEAEVLLIAIPSAGSELVTEVSDAAQALGLDVKVLPPLSDLLGDRVGVADIRDVTVADLLGRHEIRTDVASIAGYLTGKRVLVTGAGGSIGAELCRQIYQFAPAELVMLDRDESALHAVQLSIDGRALLDSPDLVLCDIRDEPRLLEVFHARRPEVVFHAAALKHLPLLELHPQEAVKSNVVASLKVLEAARATCVERFVNISTDKAADPVSVLGYTKRISERLTAWYAMQDDGVYLSVRFGNVLASRGSVLETFQAQIAAGGPLTVTHPDVSRYFMTIPEAVELVIQAGAIGRDGEALVLDMGSPVRIDDVAKRLVANADRPVHIQYTGLRPGEKLHEVLLGKDEPDHRPMHPLISHVAVPPLAPGELLGLFEADTNTVVDELRRHCNGGRPGAPVDRLS
jgi:FlaA1/EpsC-like NDP-sugar epimerase